MLLILAMLIMTNDLPVHAQAPPSREYQLKAVFLFYFTQFVDWPSGSFASAQSPLVIGVLGKNPFGAYLDSTVSGEKKDGHEVIVRYYDHEEEAANCHLLFLNEPDSKKRKKVLNMLEGENTLTVSDVASFLNEGGMVRFFTSNNKIKLQINLEATKESKLVISSKLLRVAEIMKPD